MTEVVGLIMIGLVYVITMAVFLAIALAVLALAFLLCFPGVASAIIEEYTGDTEDPPTKE